MTLPIHTEAASGQPRIDIRDLWQVFQRQNGQPVPVARGINLEIEAGEFVCVIGPSGCGKTTLLHMLAGLLAPASGEILVHGAPVTGPAPERGVVFQKDSVFPWMRVINNVEYGLACRGVPKSERRDIARHFLDAVGLAHVEHSWPRELSGGMLKRVAVATVFANDAQVLLLDEPFGPLDYVTRRQLQKLLLRLWKETPGGSGTARTVLFVTHDVDEALTLADRVLVMKDGHIADDLKIELERPRTDDVLAHPQGLAYKHRLLRHLGIDDAQDIGGDGND